MWESLKATVVGVTLVVMCVSAIAPGQTATMLRGYVSQEQEQSESRQLAATAGATGVKVSGSVTQGSFPSTYAGNWRCLTVVTDSALDTVPNGQQVESDIQFNRAADGRILVNWNQSGWSEAQATVTSWSPSQAQIDRTDYYFGEGMNGSWAARSRDRFTLIAPDKMVAQSYVDQYIDGQYLGRYRTKSVLSRQASNSNVATAAY